MSYVFPQTNPEPLEFVSLATAKAQLRLEEDFYLDDAIIQMYIDASIQKASDYTGLDIQPKDWILKGNAFESKVFTKNPVSTISKIEYYDTNNTKQTLTNTEEVNYSLVPVDSLRSKILFHESTALPSLKDRFDAVNIFFTTGYTEETIPKPIIQAILLYMSFLYENREDRPLSLPTAFESLLRPYRIHYE